MADVPNDVLSITGAGNIVIHGPGGDAIEISVIQGVGSGLDADTVDGLDASALASAVHDHSGESWSVTEGTTGLAVFSSMVVDAIGIIGSALTSEGIGVKGSSNGSNARGVVGTVFGESNFSIGVDGKGGTGVRGIGTASSDSENIGVLGEGVQGVIGTSTHSSGRGVIGNAESSFGPAFGVWGLSQAASGYGGFFENSAGAGLKAQGAGNEAPDLVLGGSLFEDDGVISSDPLPPSSDLFLVSNDAVVVQLENDGVGSDEDADFEIRRNGGTVVFRVDDTDGAEIADDLVVRGNLTVDGTFNSLSGLFGALSDRNRKENLTPADPREVLDRVVSLPIQRWNYIHDTADTPHLGPMAQDFRAAFGLGADERTIATVDADGVALAAIQGLYRLLEEQSAEIDRLREQVLHLQRQTEP